MLAFLLKGASFTHALEAFEVFEVQVGKALLAFCVAPLVLAAAFAAHDFGATRELKRRIERNATLSSAPSKAATHLATPLKQTSHDDGSLVHGNVPLLDV